MTLIEAMTQDTLVIGGKDSGAVPSVLDGGKAGILVDVTNIGEMSSMIQKVYSEYDTYQDMIAYARRYVKGKYEIGVIVEKYIALYRELCG
jgi:glycosyltransferase involved in cell wall biosynthesis